MSEPTHRAVIAELDVDARAHLLAKSDTAGLLHLAGHGAAIAVTTWLVLLGGAWRPLFMVVHGMVIGFLFSALHETVHRTPFRSRTINDAVGRICGIVVFIAPGWFRHYHLAHHRFTNDPGNDPELQAPRPATVSQYLLYLSGLPDWVSRLSTIWCNAVVENRDEFVPARARAAVKREALTSLAIYSGLVALSAATGSMVLIVFWWLPLVMGGPALRAYLLAEHAGCPPVPSMFENTRTVLTNRLVRFFAWNMPYHVEHHTFPGVPFHRLADLHRHLAGHLAVTDSGYVRFNLRFVESLRRTRPLGRRLRWRR